MEVQISRLAQISAINQAPLSGDMLCRVSYDILDHAWVLNFPLSAPFLVSWQSLVENLIIGFSDWNTCPLASSLTCADSGENLKKPRWNAELGARTHCPGFPLCV